MAIPLEPDEGMFPDAFLAPFILAPEVEDLAGLVMASCEEFRTIDEARRDSQISIVYVFETKPYDPTKEDFKPHTIAKVSKASPLWRALTNYDLAIQFRQAFWDAFSDRQRQAVLHHELCHLDVEEPDEQGRVKFGLKPHDIEDFNRTIRRFGSALPGRAQFFKSFLDWQHEQERPEPTRLRPISDVEAARDLAGDDSPFAVVLDETDLRPKGEVNIDELRGAVDRSVEPDDETPS